MKARVKKGDLVYVLSGNYKGDTGRVLAVFPNEERAIVEKVNMVTKHKRRTRQQEPGGLVSQEASIPLCKLMLVDPKTNEPTRVRIEKREDGTKVRVSKSTGNPI